MRRDKVLLDINTLICVFYNCFVKTRNIFRIKNHSDWKNLRHRSNTIFVIGNGPSLNNLNLNLIRNFDSITVNLFYKGNCSFKSTYHLLYDIDFQNDDMSDSIDRILLANPNVNFIINKKFNKIFKEKLGLNNSIIEVDCPLLHSGKYVEYGLNKQMTGSLNVIPIAIETAMALGYKNICLIGCDFSLYAQHRGAHFYDQVGSVNAVESDDEYNVGNLIRCALVHKQHYSIERTAKRDDITIVNATEGSLIEAYPFVNYQKYVEEIANYE